MKEELKTPEEISDWLERQWKTFATGVAACNSPTKLVLGALLELKEYFIWQLDSMASKMVDVVKATYNMTKDGNNKVAVKSARLYESSCHFYPIRHYYYWKPSDYELIFFRDSV